MSRAGTTRACPPSRHSAAAATRPRRIRNLCTEVGVNEVQRVHDFVLLENADPRGPQHPRPARHGRARPLKVVITNWAEGDDTASRHEAPPTTPRTRRRHAHVPFGASSTSSATTSWRTRPRSSSASSRAARSASATATGSPATRSSRTTRRGRRAPLHLRPADPRRRLAAPRRRRQGAQGQGHDPLGRGDHRRARDRPSLRPPLRRREAPASGPATPRRPQPRLARRSSRGPSRAQLADVRHRAFAAGTGTFSDGIERFQFERHGYFCIDPSETQAAGRPVFNRTVTLKDSWSKQAGK
jgi:glutaminyl-tRNA synthetase